MLQAAFRLLYFRVELVRRGGVCPLAYINQQIAIMKRSTVWRIFSALLQDLPTVRPGWLVHLWMALPGHIFCLWDRTIVISLMLIYARMQKYFSFMIWALCLMLWRLFFLSVHVLSISTFLFSLIGLVMCWTTCITTYDTTSQFFSLLYQFISCPRNSLLPLFVGCPWSW